MNRMSAADRRRALTAAALRVAERDGLAAASTRSIVAEAGMSLASFHYAVESHEALLREVIGLVVAGEAEAAQGALGTAFAGDAADLRSAVRAAFGGYLDLVRAAPGREQAMLELTQHALRAPALAHLPREQYAAYHRMVRGLLGAAQERFAVAWDVPLDDLARLVVTLTDGLTLGWLATRDDDAAERLLDLAADAVAAHGRHA